MDGWLEQSHKKGHEPVFSFYNLRTLCWFWYRVASPEPLICLFLGISPICLLNMKPIVYWSEGRGRANDKHITLWQTWSLPLNDSAGPSGCGVIAGISLELGSLENGGKRWEMMGKGNQEFAPHPATYHPKPQPRVSQTDIGQWFPSHVWAHIFLICNFTPCCSLLLLNSSLNRRIFKLIPKWVYVWLLDTFIST